MIILKRHMILLEVLIALSLIVMCAMPLIYPHVFLLQAQRKFVKTIELDHDVNLLYADVFQRMHTGEISWGQIHEKREIPVDDAMWMRIYPNDPKKIAFKGSYRFGHPLKKKTGPVWGAYVIPVIFTFAPSPTTNSTHIVPKALTYETSVYILRQLPPEEIVKETPEEAPKKDPPKGDSTKKTPKRPSEELAET